MHILFFSVYYRPDGGPAAELFTMLSEALVQRGHKVTVITTVPHYPSGEVQIAFKGWRIRKSIENGVHVIRLPLPSVNRKSLAARLPQIAVYQTLATLYSLRVDFDILVSHTSSLEGWLPFIVNSVARHKPSVYSVHDIYPDIGIKLGIIKGKFLIGLVSWLEKSSLSHASIVRTLSNSFSSRLISFGVPESRIRLIHDWVDVNKLTIVPRCNSFSSEYNILDTFNVVYAGNMGFVQGLETVLKAASLLRQENQVKLVFVGDGAARLTLIKKARQENLHNVIFIPYQSRDRMSEVWASTDIALILLRKGTGVGALPSKTFSIMAGGCPILLSIDENSEACSLVKEADAGVWVPPEDPSKIAEAILALKQDKTLRDRLGQNGRVWAEQHHSPHTAAEQFEQLLYDAIKIHNK